MYFIDLFLNNSNSNSNGISVKNDSVSFTIDTIISTDVTFKSLLRHIFDNLTDE